MSADYPRKGRGAQSNQPSRFLSDVVVAMPEDDDEHRNQSVIPIKTTCRPDTARSALTYNQSPDIPFDRSINPYRGCEHGCIYCFARPSHAYLDLSPGLDFETRLFYKTGLVDTLKTELQARSYRCDTVALSPNTDCYQPIERRFGITRQILEVLYQCRHPVSIITKSSLVLRDTDLLATMAQRNLITVVVSVTTLDSGLSARLEPRAAAPHRRLDIIEKLSIAGVPTGVLFAPVIPFINDNEIEDVLAACKQRGATSAGYVLLRLPLEVRNLWLEWLESYFPDRASRVMKTLRDAHGGKDYDSTFGKRMTGAGVYADLIEQRFNLARQRNRMSQRSMKLDTHQFNPALLSGQLQLFD